MLTFIIWNFIEDILYYFRYTRNLGRQHGNSPGPYSRHLALWHPRGLEPVPHFQALHPLRTALDLSVHPDALASFDDFGERLGSYWGYIGIMEKKMETTIVY